MSETNDNFDRLTDRLGTLEKKAWEAVEQAFPMKSANEIKSWIVNQARAIQRRPLTKAERQAALEALVEEARSRVEDYQQKVRKRFGEMTRIGEVPVSAADHRSYERAMLRLQLAEPGRERHKELRDVILRHAAPGEDHGPNLAVLQELESTLQKEIENYRFDELDDSHPLAEAQTALDMARQTTDTLKVERAEQYLTRVIPELEAVVETVAKRGAWEGPRARTLIEERWLDPAGPEEIRYARSIEMEDTESRLEDLANDLPSMDPILSDAAREVSRPEPAEPEEDPRDRLELGDGTKVKDALEGE